MSLVLSIATVDKTSLLKANSVTIKSVLSGRNTCTFTLLVDPPGDYRPVIGAIVTIVESATTRFGGTIEKYTEGDDGGAGNQHEIAVTCVDYSQLCDKRLVAATYEEADQTEGDIVTDIVTNYLTDEGVTTTNVETGKKVVKAVFPYVTVTSALDELAAIGGKQWYVDYDKDLHYFTRSTNAAPFGLTATSQNYRNLKVIPGRQGYRNVQYVRAGTALADVRTESFEGDGTLRTFVLSMPCGKAPTITLNAGAQTVGLNNLTSGMNWYWTYGSNQITQDTGGTVLTASDTLAVTYQGQYPLLTLGQNDTDIAARAAVEGGSGRYEMIEDAKHLDDVDMAIDLQKGLLERFTLSHSVTFETDTSGLLAGQLISIVEAAYGINATYLIESVSAQYIDGADYWRTTVKAQSGDSLGGWVSFFKAIERQGKAFVIRENEVILLLRFFSDGVACADSVSAASAAPESRADYALADFSEVEE